MKMKSLLFVVNCKLHSGRKTFQNELLSNSSLKSKVQTSVLGLGVDFVFPLSQQQQQKEQEEEPPPKSIRRGCTRSP